MPQVYTIHDLCNCVSMAYDSHHKIIVHACCRSPSRREKKLAGSLYTVQMLKIYCCKWSIRSGAMRVTNY